MFVTKKIIQKLSVAFLGGVCFFASHAQAADYIQDGGATVWGNISSYNSYDSIQITSSLDASGTPLSGFGFYNMTGIVTAPTITITVSGTHSDAIRQNGAQGQGGTDSPNGLMTVGDNLTIKATGLSADGLNMAITNSSIFNIGNNANIESLQGTGLRANLSKVSNAVKNTINVGDNLVVTTYANGGNIGVDAPTEGPVDLNGNDIVTGYALYAGARDYETETQGAGLITSYINIGNNSTLITSGNDAYAVYANKTGVITLGSTTITTTGRGAHGIVAQDGFVTNVDRTAFQPIDGQTVNYEGGKVYLTGDTTINVADLSLTYAMFATGKGSLIASQKEDGTVMPAKYTINGDIIAELQGVVDLHMTDGSSFFGIADMAHVTANLSGGGTIKLNIDGANSFWQMPSSSAVTDLVLSNNPKIYLGDQSIAVTRFNNVELETSNLSGNGIFYLRTDMSPAALVGDIIIVNNSSSGAHQLVFADNKTGGYTGAEELKVVDFTGANQANNTAIFTSAGADVGAYVYGLKQKTDGDWYLSDGKPTGSGGSPTPTPTPDPVLPPLTNPASNAVNFLNVNYYLGFIENQSLLQRMGELRRSPGKDGEVWVRTFGGKFDDFGSKRLSGFDMSYWSIQAGIDRRIELNNNEADLFVGVMGGYTKGDVNFKVGDGDAKQYHVGAYLTYKHQNGFYVDALAKYLHAKNSYNTLTTNGYHVNGDASADGYSLGAEVGQRFYMDKVNKLGFYIEPQAQLTFTHMGSSSFKSSNGLYTKLGGYDSLLGRASAVFGYSLNKDGNPIDLYFKTGYLKEFDGKTSYSFNKTLQEDFKFNSGWWDNGIGVNVQIDKNKNLYMDANYAVGSKFNTWQFNAGYRQQF